MLSRTLRSALIPAVTVVLSSVIVTALATPKRLYAIQGPGYTGCTAFDVAPTQPNGSVSAHPSGGYQWIGTWKVLFGCTSGAYSSCFVCYKASTQAFGLVGGGKADWYDLGGSYNENAHMSPSYACGTTNNTINLTTTVTGLPTGIIMNGFKYRTLVYAKRWDPTLQANGTPLGCDGDYTGSNYQEYTVPDS